MAGNFGGVIGQLIHQGAFLFGDGAAFGYPVRQGDAEAAQLGQEFIGGRKFGAVDRQLVQRAFGIAGFAPEFIGQALELFFRGGVFALFQGDIDVVDIVGKLAEGALIAVFHGGSAAVGGGIAADGRSGQGDQRRQGEADDPNDRTPMESRSIFHTDNPFFASIAA